MPPSGAYRGIMKKFLFIGLPLQCSILFLIAVCWFKLPYAWAAENILNFWGILVLVVSFLAIFINPKNYQKKADDPEYEIPNLYRVAIMNLLVFIQFVILAAMGWYWIAGGLALGRVVFSMERDAVKKLRKERDNNVQTS